MSLLTELLAITAARAEELLNENLGNLNSLGAGKLINVVKQRFRNEPEHRRGSGGSELATFAVGKKLARDYWSGVSVGPTSELVTIPKLVDFADVRKAMRTNEGRMIALYAPQVLDSSTAVMVIIDEEQNLSRPSGHVGFAWDFGPVMKKLSAEKQEQLTAVIDKHLGKALDRKGGRNSDGSRSGYNETEDVIGDKTTSAHTAAVSKKVSDYDKRSAMRDAGKTISDTRKQAYTEYEDWSDAARAMANRHHTVVIKKDGDARVAHYVTAGEEGSEIGRWSAGKGYITRSDEPFNRQIERVYSEERNYAGVSMYVSNVKAFIEDVIKLTGKLTGKVVKVDFASINKKKARAMNRPSQSGPMTDEQIKAAKEDLMFRLKKYKNSKIDNAADAKDFVAKVISGGLKKLNFEGATYVLSKPSTYYTTTLNGDTLLKGKEFDVTYDADHETSTYGHVTITMKLVNGMLTPVKMKVGSKEYAL